MILNIVYMKTIINMVMAQIFLVNAVGVVLLMQYYTQKWITKQ